MTVICQLNAEHMEGHPVLGTKGQLRRMRKKQTSAGKLCSPLGTASLFWLWIILCLFL